jgi:hypothetical protein
VASPLAAARFGLFEFGHRRLTGRQVEPGRLELGVAVEGGQALSRPKPDCL